MKFSASVVALAVLVAAALAPAPAAGKVVRSSVKLGTSKPVFHFLTLFGYDDHGGGRVEFKFTPNTAGQVFVAFYDEQWDKLGKLHGSEFDCNKVLGAATANNASFALPTNETSLAFAKFQRPRFWYFGLINCGEGGLDTSYELTMLNHGGPWTRQFSVDSQGMMATYLVFALVFAGGFAVHMYGVMTKWRTEGMHPIVKLLTIAIAVLTASVFCEFVHLAVYSTNGVGAPVMGGISQVLDMGAQLVFMLLLILIGKGWTISTTRLTDRRALFVILAAFLFVYVALFIWQEAGQDPASTKYAYESVPGIVLLVLRGITLLWFLFCLYKTFGVEIHPEKRKFYAVFGVLYTLWFLGLPAIVGVASALDPWVRRKTVTAIYLLFNTAAMSGLGWLLWPTRAHVYFKIGATDLLAASSTPYDQI
jgi:hypothetical protein